MSYKYILNPKHHTFKEHLLHIETLFQATDETIHKARNEIKTIAIEKDDYIVKSFKVPHLLNRFIYTFFRDSKAKKSYDNAIRIKDFTPEPIAFIEYYKFSLLKNSYFIAKNFNYDFTIREALLDANFPDRNKIFEEFATFTYALHQNNIFHLDYSPGNILIKKKENGYNFKIVDINRMQFKELSLEKRLENFNKLWASDIDMAIIINKYAQLINKNPQKCIEKAIYYSQKNKNFKNFKKRLKGKKVVD